MSQLNIATFIDIYDKKYSCIVTLYIPIKFIKSLSIHETQVEINGRYFYKFDTIDIAKKYVQKTMDNLKW